MIPIYSLHLIAYIVTVIVNVEKEFFLVDDPFIPRLLGPFYLHGFSWISAWLSNHMPSKVWGETIHLFPNFNGATIEVEEWIDNFIPHFILDVIIYPYDQS